MDFARFEIGIYAGLASGFVSLLTALFLLHRLLSAPTMPPSHTEGMRAKYERMVEISSHIQNGAAAFMRTEYRYLTIFVILVAAIIASGPFFFYQDVTESHGLKTAINFVCGAFLSGLAGWIGMFTAVRANVRTTTAATVGLNPALKIAFRSGCVMGLTVVSFGIIGLCINLWIFRDPAVLAGFGFGASSIALFARVGGGIFTKAADVGADLCGKVARDLDEDDPRNPAVIADNVGDNVGDVAGMGADLFESYVGSIIACLTLAEDIAQGNTDLLTAYSILPFLIAGGGIFCSIIGSLFVSVKEEGTMADLLWALRKGLIVSSALVIGWTIAVTQYMSGAGLWTGNDAIMVSACILIGLFSGLIIGIGTEFCTSFEYYPVQTIAHAGKHGPAPVVIQGMGIGMLSTVVPVVTIVVAILSCSRLAGLYGVAIAGVGMLSTLGITLATDAYGAVVDNAGGIAEMAQLDEYVRANTDALDALGNTTAATGKGFAIGSAVLTAIALMASFIISSRIPVREDDSQIISVMDAVIIPGILLGAMLPFVFAALTMLSVRRGAHDIMDEVNRQFRKREAIFDKEGSYDKWSPDHSRCVAIATQSAVVEMLLPGGMAVICPVMVGFGLGAKALAGLLVGAIAAGFLLAITMANAGGAWDNAKKFVEAGHIPGHGKHSKLHKATVTGDTVGDPFKDTSGPSLNILIKLMSIVSLVLAPVFPAEPYKGIVVAGILLAILGVLVASTSVAQRSSLRYSNLQRKGSAA